MMMMMVLLRHLLSIVNVLTVLLFLLCYVAIITTAFLHLYLLFITNLVCNHFTVIEKV